MICTEACAQVLTSSQSSQPRPPLLLLLRPSSDDAVGWSFIAPRAFFGRMLLGTEGNDAPSEAGKLGAHAAWRATLYDAQLNVKA